MTRDDLPAVVGLEVALFGREAWTREMLVGELAGVPSVRHYLVAEERPAAEAGAAGQVPGQAAGQGPGQAAGQGQRGVVVGYAGLLVPGGGQADVLTLAVAEDHWGHGIGAALLRGLLAEAASRDCREVFLEVRVDNARAQRLYRGYGFAEVGLRRGYYQPSGMDALVMRLDLSEQPSQREPGRREPGQAVPGPAQAAVAGVGQPDATAAAQAGVAGSAQAEVTAAAQAGTAAAAQAEVAGSARAGVAGSAQAGVAGSAQAGVAGSAQAGVAGSAQAGVAGAGPAGGRQPGSRGGQ
jgi:ribosomal-protein-alanine N-acetyltransferase